MKNEIRNKFIEMIPALTERGTLKISISKARTMTDHMKPAPWYEGEGVEGFEFCYRANFITIVIQNNKDRAFIRVLKPHERYHARKDWVKDNMDQDARAVCRKKLAELTADNSASKPWLRKGRGYRSG